MKFENYRKKIGPAFSVETILKRINIHGGGIKTFIFLLICGFIMFGLLFSTVHNRKKTNINKHTPSRYNLLIKFWGDRGYFKHGGMWVWGKEGTKPKWNPPKSNEPVTRIYESSGMGFLMFANIIERIYMGITGKFSITLMRYHNQFFVLLSSVLLGFFAYRFSRRMGMSPTTNVFIALTCQFVYQTFPVNLSFVWEVSPSAVVIPFLLMIIIQLEYIYNNLNPSTSKVILTAICSFFAFYINGPITCMFFLFMIAGWLILGESEALKKTWIKIVLIPFLCALTIIVCQLIIVKLNFPEAEFMGSSLILRTGLDGSTLKYFDHWDLLTNYRRDIGHGYLQWKFLFSIGLLSLAVFMVFFQRLIKEKYIAFVIYCLLSIYFPLAFVLSQSFAIHPYYYDNCIAIPMVLLTFCILPIILEKLTGQWGGFSLLFFVIAFCYCFVQLRQFMITYPL